MVVPASYLVQAEVANGWQAAYEIIGESAPSSALPAAVGTAVEMEEEEAEAAGGWADEDAKHPDEEFGSSQVGWKFYSGSGGEARAAFSLARPRVAVPAMASQSSLVAAAAMSEEDAMEAAMEAARVRGAKAAAVHVDATGEEAE